MRFSENDIETTIIPSPQTRYAGTNEGVRVKHISSNIAVESTSAPSQYLNMRIALAMLQCQRFRFIPFQSFFRLYSHVQRQFTVNSVHPFVVEAEAFYVAQVQKAQTKPPVALTASDAEQSVGNDFIFLIQLRLIAIATFADNKQLAGKNLC